MNRLGFIRLPSLPLFLAPKVFKKVFGIHTPRHELSALVPELPKQSFSTLIDQGYVTQIDHIPAVARPVARMIPIRAELRYPRARQLSAQGPSVFADRWAVC